MRLWISTFTANAIAKACDLGRARHGLELTGLFAGRKLLRATKEQKLESLAGGEQCLGSWELTGGEL